MPISEILNRSAKRLPDKTALHWRDQSLTYADLNRRANRLANALTALKLPENSRLAILSVNRPEYVVAYYAISRTAHISVHCSTRSSVDELVFFLHKCKAEVIFTEAAFLPVLGEVLPKLVGAPIVVSFDAVDRTEAGNLTVVSTDDFTSQHTDRDPKISRRADDPLAITFTGGTTGYPKGVVVSHGARAATVVACECDFGLEESDVFLASTPLYHTVGLFVWLGTSISLGATTVLQDAWSPEEFIRLVRKYDVTAAFLVPSQLNRLILSPQFSADALRSLANIGYAGAPMSRALFDRIRKALPHVLFTENYGQSEVCPITVRSIGHGEQKFSTVGRPAFNAEVEIVDGDGNFLPTGETGDIVTRGPTLFREYFEDREETDNAFSMPDGWLLTGDVGFLDEDGFLTLVDRSKDMLISGGVNVYPTEIENALYQHTAVAECAVFGVPDEEWGELPAAHVVLMGDATATPEELMEFCANKIARFKRPRIIKFVESLPKTPVGKIRKNVIRDQYWEGHEKKI